MVIQLQAFALSPALVRVESQLDATFDLEGAAQNKENERVQNGSKCGRDQDL